MKDNPFELEDEPVKITEISEAELCPEIFRDTDIRCQRPIHLDPNDTNICYAVGLDPYFYVIWERTNEPTNDEHRPT